MCTSAESGKSYFQNALSRGEYYHDEKILNQEIVGLWGGKAAELLGIAGRVDRASFDRLCDNLHPDTDERITTKTVDGRRVGYDLNFHVPKSVSVMLELGGDQRILTAFRDAVQHTMRELEKETETRVRKGGADTTRKTGNLAWAEFVHLTARPVDGVPDPHLHAHCFAFNATFDETERQWKAADIGPIKYDAPYFQATFHARLKGNLAYLGYEIERRRNSWELAGVPDAVTRKFSRRTDEIERIAQEKGISDAVKKGELGARTRQAKLSVTSMETLRAHWDRRLTEGQHQALLNVLERCRDGLGGSRLNRSSELHSALDSALNHMLERRSTIPDRQLVAAALDRTEGGVTPEEMWVYIESRIADGSILRGEYKGVSVLTTPEVFAEEQAMLKAVKDGKGQFQPLKIEHECIDEALSAEQRDAVNTVLRSRNGVMLIRGKAGVGKTRLMNEVVGAIESQGITVLPVAPTAHATHEVLREDGFETAQTVAHFLGNAELRSKLRGQVLWVDEAGLMGIRDMNRLVSFAKETGARLILTGDTAQHHSVQRGDPLKLIEELAYIKPAEVKQIRRQTHAQYREACMSLSEGKIEKGFKQLEKMGAIKEVEDQDRAKVLAGEYLDSIKKKIDTLVISPTHREGNRVTHAIREQLRQDEIIGKKDRVLAKLEPRHLTQSQKMDHTQYQAGDIVQFFRNAKDGIKAGDRGEVYKVNDKGVVIKRERDGRTVALPTQQPDRFGVFAKSELKLSKGDRVRITNNGRSKDNAHRLSNGSIYTIDGFTREGDIRLKNGWTVPKGFGHMTHGYCVTSDSSQGRGVKHVIIAQAAESSAASSIQQFYTSVTRGKNKVTIITDSKKRLLRSVMKDASRVSATEAVKKFNPMIPPKGISRSPVHMKQVGQWLQFRQAQALAKRAREMASKEPMRMQDLHRQRDQLRKQSKSTNGRNRGRFEGRSMGRDWS
tara:strand:- start:6041 stop:8902 length:2862 start_codon:yes stop_codon:yes gene_type:complete